MYAVEFVQLHLLVLTNLHTLSLNVLYFILLLPFLVPCYVKKHFLIVKIAETCKNVLVQDAYFLLIIIKEIIHKQSNLRRIPIVCGIHKRLSKWCHAVSIRFLADEKSRCSKSWARKYTTWAGRSDKHNSFQYFHLCFSIFRFIYIFSVSTALRGMLHVIHAPMHNSFAIFVWIGENNFRLLCIEWHLFTH